MIKNLKSSKMEKMLVNNEESSVPRGIVLPGSLTRELWDAMALFLTLVFTFTIPYQISYSSVGISLPRFFADLCMDIFFISDFYARMRKFAVIKEGNLVTDPKEFQKVYIANEFQGDLLSVIPLSFVGFFINVSGERYGMLRLFQLLRVRRFGKYFDAFIESCKNRAQLHISTALIRVIQIFFIVLFLCHWIACTYHFIGRTSNEINWLSIDGSSDSSMHIRYLRSFYWSLYTGKFYN